MRRGLVIGMLGICLLCGGSALAQQPRSVIPWLSQILTNRSQPADDTLQSGPTGAVTPFSPSTIEVSGLDDPIRNGAGLIAPEASGLPSDLWRGASALRVRGLLLSSRPSGVPAARALFRDILLAQTEPPAGSGPENRVLLARIDVLMDSGMLAEAEDLLTTGNIIDAPLFRRAFDLGLLTGRSDERCKQLRDSPALSPTLPARVYCLARLGDWPAAALTLNLGREVGSISAAEEELLARFLDPGGFEGLPELAVTRPLTTLNFVLREAVALPRPTTTLPLAFLAVDTVENSPLRDQIQSKERLVREGAIPAESLFESYRDGTPAASGGVWDRMAAVRELDRAFATQDPAAVARILPGIDAQFAGLRLRSALAEIYARQLAALPFDGMQTDSRVLIAELLLLAGERERALEMLPVSNDAVSNFLRALAARSESFPSTEALSPLKTAVALGLSTVEPRSEASRELQRALDQGQVGVVLIRTLDLLSAGVEVDPGDLTDALYLLRRAGQEDVAWQVATETLLLLPEA
ncbi:MAG: hypothetical protein AAGF22_08930 [Pseudomonadota bacterium]